MVKQHTIILFLFFISLTATLHAQKKVTTTYFGGHGCIDLTLELYSDSTYRFERRSGLFIPSKAVTKGAYLIADSSITLYRKKKLHFLYFKLENKYHEDTYRIRNDKILLYSPAREASADSAMIKDYNTLWRSNN
ncbi:hypothetical protein [Ferruginibacter sp.]